MKRNKLDFMLFLKLSCLNLILYLIAAIIIILPISIVMVSDITLSKTFSKALISTSFIFISAGKFITFFKKNKGDKTKINDLAVIVGFLIVLISYLLK
ncbi:hypothetical protein [Clostridium sp. UBA1652]|uniref:hypothetical protein n=1 Tax=Clostridium sp. UBA1652 TaxID=1946348 RepID=UPI00257EE6CC|nr:hypothetical protein [Clostridium sp. UBA1652]